MFDKENYKRCFTCVRAPEDTLDKVYRRLNRSKLRTISRTSLLVAVLVPLFILTALAAGLSGILLKDTGEEGNVSCFVHVAKGNRTEYKELDLPAKLYLEFNIDGESKKVLFTPGWLPGQHTPDFRDENGYEMIRWGTEGRGSGDFLFNLSIYNGAQLEGKKFIFWQGADDEFEVLRNEKWQDWQRIDVKQETHRGDGSERQCNYVLLFSEEFNYLMILAGDQSAGTDFTVLEKIAEDLSIKVTDVPALRSHSPIDYNMIALAWG